MPRVVHFEIQADNPQRASRFYQKVFDWEISKWDGPQDYWLIATGEKTEPGINGGMMRRHGSVDPVRNTIQVSDVDEYVKKVTDNGGEIVEPKMPIPGMGYLAYCKDTEGNVFGIMHTDPTAK